MASNLALTAIGSFFSNLFGLIDGLHTSEEEKLAAQRDLLQTQTGLIGEWLEHERAMTEAKAKIIMAEAQGESWLQRNWRPLTMLALVGLIMGRWTGLYDSGIPLELEQELFTLVQIGLGGYVVGRSAEKVTANLFNKKGGGDG